MSHSMLWASEAQVRTCENHKVKNGTASLQHSLKHDHLVIMYGSDSAIVWDYIITKSKMAQQVSSNAWNTIRDIAFGLCNRAGLVKTLQCSRFVLPLLSPFSCFNPSWPSLSSPTTLSVPYPTNNSSCAVLQVSIHLCSIAAAFADGDHPYLSA